MITLTREEMQKVEHYIKPYAIVPVDMQTTQLLVNALRAKLSEPQREWVGLTSEEMAAAWSQSKGDVLYRLKPFASAVEQALKEKNA